MASTAVPQVWRPSGARTVALDALLPLPRGVVPSDVPPLVWPAKDPGDVLDYALDATAALAGDTTDRIATVAVTLVPNASRADLQLGNVVADGAVAVMWLSGGQAGTVYSVQVDAEHAERAHHRAHRAAAGAGDGGGRTAGRRADHRCRRVVTDQNGNPILVGA